MNDVLNTKAAARLTGVAYLVMIVFSAGGYATMTRLLAGDSQIVLRRLADNEGLFNLAFGAMGIGFAAWVVLAFMLYRLMSLSGRLLGFAMLIFTVAGAATNLTALSYLSPLIGPSAPGMDAGTLVPTVASYNRVLLLAQVFSGLWMFPFGWLVLRSRIAPRLLGGCLIIGGFGYLFVFATAFEPSLDQMMAYRMIAMIPGAPAMIGEIGMCLWLLIKGARVQAAR